MINEKGEFEAWLRLISKSPHFAYLQDFEQVLFESEHGVYLSDLTNAMWYAWSARASMPTQKDLTEQCKLRG